jgi:hypothetical protein
MHKSRHTMEPGDRWGRSNEPRIHVHRPVQGDYPAVVRQRAGNVVPVFTKQQKADLAK